MAALISTPALPALAQFRVEVTGVGLTQLPVASAAQIDTGIAALAATIRQAL